MQHGFILSIIGIIVSLVSLGVTTYYAWIVHKRTVFINTVTSERVKWIGKVRESISEFCGLTYHWVVTYRQGNLSPEEKKKEEELLRKIDILKTMIKLQLNPNGEDDKKIMTLIDEIPKLTKETTRDKLKEALRELTKTTQYLLKSEWEKVKDEAEKGRLHKRDIKSH